MFTDSIKFNIDTKLIDIVKDFAHIGSFINSKGDWNQVIKRRPGFVIAVIEDLEEITKSRDISFEAKANIIHTF